MKTLKTIQSGSSISLIFMLVSLLNFGCKQEVPQSVIYTETFYKTWALPGFQSGAYIKEDEQDNILVYAADYTDTTLYAQYVGAFSQTGQLISKKTNSVYIDGAHIVTEKDGSVLCNSGYQLSKLDKNGNVIFSSFTEDLDYPISFPLHVKSNDKYNGCYLASVTNGGSTGNPSTNQIVCFDKDGKFNPDAITIPDTYFGLKVLSLNIYRYENPRTLYFWGYGFKDWTGSWGQNPQTFLAKIQFNTNFSSVINSEIVLIGSYEDANFHDYHNNPPAYQLMNEDDKSIIISLNHTNKLTGMMAGHLVKIDPDMKVEWEKNIPFDGMSASIYSLEKCGDGGFLATGTTSTSQSRTMIPYFCKFDKDGNYSVSHILYGPYTGYGLWTIQLRDGGYLMTGRTTGFGKGTNEEDMFLLKTDKDGNLK